INTRSLVCDYELHHLDLRVIYAAYDGSWEWVHSLALVEPPEMAAVVLVLRM
ncbi:hypothetical protein CEXT_788961, partial [Caerostris extrusa]